MNPITLNLTIHDPEMIKKMRKLMKPIGYISDNIIIPVNKPDHE
jgi:hypothetical protein